MFASRVLPKPAALTDRDTIILSDFVNNTNEPVFDGALKVALAVALEQSHVPQGVSRRQRAGDVAADAAIA